VFQSQCVKVTLMRERMFLSLDDQRVMMRSTMVAR